MPQLWLLKGGLDAPGWNALRQDMKDEKVDIVHLDPKVWAIVQADEPPSGYEGLEAIEPPTGLYLDPNGSPLYVVDGAMVHTAKEVVDALGEPARELLGKLGDPHTVLERLGRAY